MMQSRAMNQRRSPTTEKQHSKRVVPELSEGGVVIPIHGAKVYRQIFSLEVINQVVNNSENLSCLLFNFYLMNLQTLKCKYELLEAFSS